jgi:uncharacterized membrane protein
MANEAQQKIESYLTKLRGHLRGLSEETAREILKELRSHIMEKAAAEGTTAAAVDAALAALGMPEELAQEYVTDELLARAEVSRSPLRILDGLVRWASLSIAGFFVLVASITGYFLGVVFILVAALKPFHPDAAGLWVLGDAAGDSSLSIHMGFGYAPVVGHEVLGWWIVPIGLLSGCLLLILTTRFAVLCSRLYRKSRALPSRG